MAKNITDIMKEITTRIAAASYQMGVDGVDKYMASIKINTIVDECFKDLEVSFEEKEEDNYADVMDRIASDPDRFIRGVTIIDHYPRVLHRDNFTIIKEIPIDSTEARIYGVSFEDGKCIYVMGKRYLSGNYISSKEYRQVEIPSWAKR